MGGVRKEGQEGRSNPGTEITLVGGEELLL